MIRIVSLNLCNLGADADPARLAAFGTLIAGTLASPAILAVQELKALAPPGSNGAVCGGASFTALSEAITAAGGPAYAWREVPPLADADGGQQGFNIRVGLLFDPARVRLREHGTAGPLDATGLRRRADGIGLTLSPGRIAPALPAFSGCAERHWLPSRKALIAEFEVLGAPLFVLVCHLKSMRAASRRAEDYAKKQRHAQAEAIHEFCAHLLRAAPAARLLVVGDMNDVTGSKTLDILKGELLVNLMEALPRSERYTYRHSRRPVLLDHALASPALAPLLRAWVPHVHSDAAGPAASDHDPVVIDLAVPAGYAAT